MKKYKVSALSLAFHYLIMTAFIIVVLFLVPIVLTGEEDLDGKIFFSFWSIGVLIIVIFFLRMPKSIEYNPDLKKLIFKSIFSKKEIDAQSVQKIKTTPINSAFITFLHESGRFILINRIDGVHEHINELKENNPNIEIKGC